MKHNKNATRRAGVVTLSQKKCILEIRKVKIITSSPSKPQLEADQQWYNENVAKSSMQ